MHYDQSWMGQGMVGGLEAGLISVLAGLLLFGVFHWLGRRQGWSHASQIGWAFLLSLLLSAGDDLGNLFYFNYAPLQSVPLLRAKLAGVHDPGSMGLRVVCELVGVAIGIYVGWLLSPRNGWRRYFKSRKQVNPGARVAASVAGSSKQQGDAEQTDHHAGNHQLQQTAEQQPEPGGRTDAGGTQDART